MRFLLFLHCFFKPRIPLVFFQKKTTTIHRNFCYLFQPISLYISNMADNGEHDDHELVDYDEEEVS